MAALLDAVAFWPSLLLVVVVFGFAPGFCLRLIILAYPRSDPRRAELIAELYTVPRIQRPLWVAEQLEVALFEGLAHRISAATHQLTRRRLAFWAGGPVGLVVGAVMIVMITAAPQPAPPGMPLPNCPTCIGGKTFTQQAGAGNQKPTFRDPRVFEGRGPSVQPGQRVEVVCRFHDPHAPPSVQPGWWYLIASPSWNRQYYTVANSYFNGDPPEGPHVTPVDNGVPVC